MNVSIFSFQRAVPGMIQAVVLALLLTAAFACKPREETFSPGQHTPEASAAAAEAVRPNGPLQIVEVPPFVHLAKRLSPVVVNISTSRSVKGFKIPQFRSPFQGPGGENPFGEFFEKFFENPPGGMRKQTSSGSGFIIDASGLVVTNNHVVENAEDIEVKMSDGKIYEAKVMGRDPKTDVALIKIESDEPFPFAALGDSGELQIGEWVMAIGNPFGLGHTVTAGIVSAKGRVLNSGPYDDFIQTDASINPGNSGGPLFNIRGEVVGINTAIVPNAQGIGFAVPINLAKNILSQLEQTGKVVRGWLGVSIQRIDQNIAESLGLEDNKGALVADVMKDSPAQRAGIKRRDVIIEFNGKAVDDFHNLPTMVASVVPGEDVQLKILREGEELTISVTIDEMEDDRQAGLEPSPKIDAVGMKVQALTKEQAESLGLEGPTGVGVVRVRPGSVAGEAGIQPGDVILEINRKSIGGLEDYETAMKEGKQKARKDGDRLLILIRRGESSFYVALELG